MSPRSSVAEARRTRKRILDRSVAVASVEGLDGLTIKRLANDLGMSQAGVLGPFGTKEDLQIATLGNAAEILFKIMLEPAAAATPGLARLEVLFEGWMRYLGGEREIFPGGCILTTAAVEFDARSGRVRDEVVRLMSLWQEYVSGEVQRAVDAGELPPDTDPDQITFELFGIFTSMNMAIQLFGDPLASDRARRALARLLPLG